MLNDIITITDRIRLASLIAILGSLGALYSLITGEIAYVEFAGALAAINAGAGVLGIARNGAGHGTGSYLGKPVKLEGRLGRVRVGEDDAA